MTGLATGNKRARLSERANDLYQSPPEAVQALLRQEQLPYEVWEPACGPGAIVGVLRAAGHHVIATDLVDYGCPDSVARRDFLMERHLPDDCNCIVTNPPFKLAGPFVRHSFEIGARKVIMLLRLAFLESEGRRDILDCGRLARVHVFRKRLPMMHRAGWDGPKASSGMAFAWFVWDADHTGPIELKRLSWEDHV